MSALRAAFHRMHIYRRKCLGPQRLRFCTGSAIGAVVWSVAVLMSLNQQVDSFVLPNYSPQNGCCKTTGDCNAVQESSKCESSCNCDVDRMDFAISGVGDSREMKLSDLGRSIAISPNGKLLAVGGKGGGLGITERWTLPTSLRWLREAPSGRVRRYFTHFCRSRR